MQTTGNILGLGPQDENSNGGNPIDQDNINSGKFYLTTDNPDLFFALTKINTGSPFTVSETEEPKFYFTYKEVGVSPLNWKKYVYEFFNIGKGDYGTGQTQIQKDELILTSIIQNSITAIINNPTTQFIELGDILLVNIETGFNAHTFIGSEDPVQDQVDGYVVVNSIMNNVVTQHLFVGAGGNYGTAGIEIAIAQDFILLNDANFSIPTGNNIAVEDEGLAINPAISKLNFVGKKSTIAEFNPNEITVLNGYKIVASKPNYIKIDDISVIDNGDTTFTIFDIQNDEIPSTLFDIKADLRYETVTLDGTSTILLNNISQEDIGKSICIKKGHHNASDGSNQHIRTQLGRVVTVTAKILSVIDNTSAVIDFTPSETAVVECYIFTNNYQQMQQAINFCLWQEIAVLKIVGKKEALVGIDTLNRGLYQADSPFNLPSLFIRSSIGSIKIVSESNSLLKLCAENVNADNYTNLFETDTGNGDIEISVNCLAPDEANTTYFNLSPFTIQLGNAGNSVRKITLINQKDRPDLCNGNDAWWTGKIANSNGGINDVDIDKIKYQEFDLDINCDTKCDGIAIFSNNGATNKIIYRDIYIPFRWNYDGENGRDFVADKYTDDSKYVFPFNIVVSNSGSTITVAENTDFSWLDYPVFGRYFTITINGVTARLINPASNDIKTINVTSSALVDGTYTGFEFTVSNNLGHPHYVHPNVAFEVKGSVKIDRDIWRYFSQGGVSGMPLYNNLINATIKSPASIEIKNGGSTNMVLYVEDSDLNLTPAFADLTAKNSKIRGNIIVKNFKSEGGNDFNILSAIVSETTEFISEGDSLGFSNLNFTSNNEVNLIFNNSIFVANRLFPIIKQGNIYISNNNPLYPIWFRKSTYNGTNVNIFLKNIECIFNGTNQGYAGMFGGNHNFTIDYDNVKISATGNDYNWAKPDFFNKESRFCGILSIPDSNIIANNLTISAVNAYPFYISQKKEIWACLLNISKFNKYKLTTGQTFNQVWGMLRSDKNLFYPYTGVWNFAYTSGEIEITYDGTNKIDLFYKSDKNGINNIRPEATIGNVVNKTRDRVAGEIVKYSIDHRNNRLIEISSNVDKHFVSTIPTHRGVQKERYYLESNNEIYFENEITYKKLNNVLTTEVFSIENRYKGTTDPTLQNIDIIDLNKHLSIGQELTDGSDLVSFSFTLIDDLDIEHTFIGTDVIVNPDFDKNMWGFSDGVDKCFIDNEAGKIVFIQNIPLYTLKATDNFRINEGLEIVSSKWIQKSDKATYTQDTLDEIDLFNVNGNFCNSEIPNSNVLFNLKNGVQGAFAEILINTATEPEITDLLETAAGNFIVGKTYKIKSIGTTDFTLIGASANTVGLNFTATGVGVGTGTATLNATKISGANWVINTDMLMIIKNNGFKNQYYFLEI